MAKFGRHQPGPASTGLPGPSPSPGSRTWPATARSGHRWLDLAIPEPDLVGGRLGLACGSQIWPHGQIYGHSVNLTARWLDLAGGRLDMATTGTVGGR